MLTRGAGLLFISLALSASLTAESIEGTVVIKKRLTKRRVTASVPLYERGPAVELDSDKDADPLAFERSRVVIYLEGKFPSEPSATGAVVREAAPAKEATIARMDQANRQFSPDTLVIQAGSKVSFPNLDPIFHNVFSLSGPKTFDLGNYPKGDTRLVAFPEPGIVYVNCHLHPNMAATIVVAPNRWNTKADGEGRFALHDVPPGKYTIVAWHKAAGFFRQQVQIAAGRDEKIEFLIPLDENGRKLQPLTTDVSALESQTR
jgi:plastocyanin